MKPRKLALLSLIVSAAWATPAHATDWLVTEVPKPTDEIAVTGAGMPVVLVYTGNDDRSSQTTLHTIGPMNQLTATKLTGWSARVAPFGRGNQVAVSSDPQKCTTPRNVRVSTGSVTAKATPATQELPGTRCERVSGLVGNARGDVVLTTISARKTGPKRDKVWLKPAGAKRFKVVLSIPVRGLDTEMVPALGPRGDLMVVWKRSSEVDDPTTAADDIATIYTRYRTVSGRWADSQLLGKNATTLFTLIRPAIGKDGRRYVSWLSAGGTKFATATGARSLMRQRTINATSAISIAPTSNRKATIAWLWWDGVETADVVNGKLGKRQELPLERVRVPVEPQLGVTSAGLAVITFYDLSESRAVKITVRRPGEAMFGTPELVASGDPAPVIGRSVVTPDGRVFVTTHAADKNWISSAKIGG